MDIHNSAKKKLIQKIKGDVFFDELTRRIYAYSASICYLVPSGVIYPLDKEDVINTIKIAAEAGIPVTARGAGSGVAGQNLGEGLILDFSMYMNRIIGFDRKNRSAVVQPGLIRSHLNKFLLSERMFFPPDPSSSDYATIGGMVANNSGGAHSLLYGTTKNYIKSLTLVTAGGEEIVVTRNGKTPFKYRTQVKDVLKESFSVLNKLKPMSFRNSSGYNLFEALQTDGEVDFTRLFCGSEGTLGIFTKIEIDVLKLPGHRSSVLLCYKDAVSALSEVKNFLDLAPSTVQALAEEFLTLISVEDPEKYARLPQGTHFVLLVEFDGSDPEDLKRRARDLIRRSSAFAHTFAENSLELEWVWEVRRLAAAYLSRLPGEKPTRWIEDAAVPVDRLSDFVLDLEKLLKKYKTSAALFGHAGQGLLHFSPRLNQMSPGFQKLIEDLGYEHALFSRKFNGVPSGEHGDGLLRTPYLEEIWGEAYPYFKSIKKIFDPNFVLNPLCIVPARDYRVSEFLRYYKGYDHKEAGALNQLINEIEACHGCGKCKDFCPVTRSQHGEVGSSRARVSILREIISGHLKQPFLRADLLEFFNLCLHCKTCKRECPTGVDVARMIESYFEEKYLHKPASFADKVLSHPLFLGKLVLKFGRLGKGAFRSVIVGKLASLVGIANLRFFVFSPLRQRKKQIRGDSDQKRAVIFSGCAGDFFSAPEIKAAATLLEKFGYETDIMSGYCCGEPAFVRGFNVEGIKKLKASAMRMKDDIRKGRPVILTSPSCLLPFLEHTKKLFDEEEAEKIQMGAQEAITFFMDQLVKIYENSSAKTHKADEIHSLKQFALNFFKCIDLRIAVQIPCHLKAIKGEGNLISFVQTLPVDNVIKLETRCCGFGGSRGFEKKWAQHADRIGQALIDEIRSIEPHIVVSPCVTCRLQIRKLLGEKIMLSEAEDFHKFILEDKRTPGRIQVVHPLILAHELLI